MRTYRELFRTPEFTPLFAASAAQTAAGTLSGLALGTLVYARTGSPLLAALSMFGPSFGQVLGALLLLSAADRLPPRTAVTLVAAAYGTGHLVLALPGMPLWGTFAVILALGVAGSLGGGVRWGLLGEILPPGGYLLGRSAFNVSVGAMQIAGFAAGGVLIAVVSPRTALVIGGVLGLGAAAIARFGLTRRPARAAGRPSVAATWRVNRRLWSAPGRRTLYLAMWVPNGLVVGCEALFVPYAPGAAGLLFIAGALGMLGGDVLTGRVLPPRLRGRFVTPLRVLLAAPYLLFAVAPAAPLAAVLVAVASAGFGAGLLLQERLLAVTPADVRGQALGLHSTGMMTMQAVGATIAGAVAQLVSVPVAIALMAVASLLVTAALTRGLRPRSPGSAAAAATPAAPPASPRH
ncbi:MFS transporter [Spirilliplanes yamanashiensis]|uniref:Membrane protein n=1 Tax=Spirilliplanes yamanashiensis TaxID=42233 RepID=A0A8J4DL10_9ACTN|nr:MFS transporter [Spirilliplanes yamanashiensis]MDP9819061.1 putative MFS family arabinose efflux permease [Spirilliplanes yamanashiensis]GIJ05516.1 membrane protein [Spirilliplanes yamanashiensis]